MKFAILEDDLIIFYRQSLVKWVRIVSVTDEKKAKRSSKNAKRVFTRQKTRIGLFEDLLVIFTTFSSFLLELFIYIRVLTSINEYFSQHV
jgi:hypothetical protein